MRSATAGDWLRVRSRRWVRAAFLWALGGLGCVGAATVENPVVTDVTTRAFSVVWASDVELFADEISLRVFASDQGGGVAQEITGDLSISLISDEWALENGVVKMDVVGLTPDTLYYVTAHTDLLNGESFVRPSPGPGIAVLTAALTTKVSATNGVIVNDLILHEVPGGADAARGTLLMVSLPGVSQYPLTAFVTPGDSSTAIVDLNNVFVDVSGASAEVAARQVLQVTWFRGRKCPPLEHRLVGYRRAPAHLESPAITELEVADRCFYADTRCDGVINLQDAQRVFDILDAAEGSCRYNPDINVRAWRNADEDGIPDPDDKVINLQDAQIVLDRLDQVEDTEGQFPL